MPFKALLAVLIYVPSTLLAQTITCDRFDVKAMLHGSLISVSLDTDLPDYTHVMVSVSRSYWTGTPLQEYPLDYFASAGTVGEWHRSKDIDVSHALWQRKREDRLRLLAGAGQPIKIAKTGDDVIVSIAVPVNQPDPRFGSGNRNLVGKRVETRGLRVVQSEVKIRYPLGGAGTGTVAEYGSPQGLKSGVTYEVTKPTPLAPERRPSDPLRAAALIRTLPVRSRITILAVDRTDRNPWYQVRAVSANGAALGSGWVNSVALIGQELKVVP